MNHSHTYTEILTETLLIICLLLILPVGAASHASAGEIPIIAPAVIDQPGSYRLTNDLSGSSVAKAIWIRASDVVLNGDKHTLGGIINTEPSLVQYGVFAGSDENTLHNITIKDLTTEQWDTGLLIANSTDLILSNCTSRKNYVGINVDGIHGATIQQCNIHNNIPRIVVEIGFQSWGISIARSDGVIVRENDIHSNNPFGAETSSSGIICTDASVVISNNHIWDHDGAGIFLSPSTRMGEVTVRDNLFDNFQGKGINIWNNRNLSVTLLNNTINAPDGIFGILSFSTSSVNITANNITIKERGISIIDSTDNILSHNTIWGGRTAFGILTSHPYSGQLPYYYHTIDDTNTVDGRPVRYYRDTGGLFIDGSTDAATIIAVNCSDGVITGQTLSRNNNGVLLVGCRNMTVNNSIFNANFYGVETQNTKNCVIKDVEASDSQFIGLTLINDSDIQLVNCTANNNAKYGISLSANEGFQLLDSTVNKNGAEGTGGSGVAVIGSRGSIARIHAEENTLFGVLVMSNSTILLDDSHMLNTNGNGLQTEGSECTVTNCEFSGSSNAGVTVYNAGAYLRMQNCTIWNNAYTGLWVNETRWSKTSIVTNNVFNNTNNLMIDSDAEPILWNVTKTAGTNIAGGRWLGGNYWANPNGTGWSQTHADRGDGFCNASYVIDDYNTDYLPLHRFTRPPGGYSTIGVYRDGMYYLRYTNSAGESDVEFAFGSAGDNPVTGHWEGLGIDTIGVYRNGMYYLRNSNSAGPANRAFAFGTAGDRPVTGDWDGDGSTTIGTYRNSVFYLRYTNSAGPADLTFAFGSAGDIPVTGDWTGTGADTIGVYRNGVFYLRYTNSAGPADLTFAFGSAGDIPVTGDWNGDGITTTGVFRNGVFYVKNSNSAGPADLTFAFGSPGDVPVTGEWI